MNYYFIIITLLPLKYISISKILKQRLSLQFIEFFDLILMKLIELKVDNQIVMAMSKNPEFIKKLSGI